MSSAVIRRRMLHGELRLRGPGHATHRPWGAVADAHAAVSGAVELISESLGVKIYTVIWCANRDGTSHRDRGTGGGGHSPLTAPPLFGPRPTATQRLDWWSGGQTLACGKAAL